MWTTQKHTLFIVGAMLCSFFFALGEYRATAAIQNCGQALCKDVYCWWVSGFGSRCSTAQVPASLPPPGPGSVNTTNAILNIFVGASLGNPPLVGAGNYDRYFWSTNTAGCAKIGGQWPSPQECTPGGTVTFDSTPVRNVCS